jgi:hypothetical protein
MLRKENFYGRGLYLTKNTIYGVPARILDATGRPFVQLPSRSGLNPGGPYFEVLNKSGAGIPLKNESGSTIRTMGVNTGTTVLLTPSRWITYSEAINTAKTFATDPTARTIPIGQIAPPDSLTLPTDYDPVTCEGGYRRARFCSTGAKAQLWMLDSEVDPHFVSGVAIFGFQGECYYFKSSDRLLVGHGETIAASDATWYPRL